MTYVISKQRRSVCVQLDLVATKLQVANEAGVSSDLREYAIAAAIFLAHGEFENYFVNVFDSVANAYSRATADSTKLPTALRSHLISEKLGFHALAIKMMVKQGEQEVLNGIERWFRSTDSVLLTGASPLCQFTGEDIYGDYTYPSIKNIERVLRRIGVGDPKGELNRQIGRDVIALLESIGSLRTALAHSAALPGVSVLDVVERIEGLKVFVEAFDKVLYKHIKTTLSDGDWLNHMC